MAVGRLVRSAIQRDPEPESQSAQIVSTLPSLEGAAEHKLEYIKTLISLCADDARQVTVYVSASFLLTVVTVNGFMPKNLSAVPPWLRITFSLSILMLGAGALCFFRYARKLHQTRMSLTRCIPSLDTVRARELWAGEAGVWHVHGRAYRLGLASFGGGLTLQAILLVGLVSAPVT